MKESYHTWMHFRFRASIAAQEMRHITWRTSYHLPIRHVTWVPSNMNESCCMHMNESCCMHMYFCLRTNSGTIRHVTWVWHALFFQYRHKHQQRHHIHIQHKSIYIYGLFLFSRSNSGTSNESCRTSQASCECSYDMWKRMWRVTSHLTCALSHLKACESPHVLIWHVSAHVSTLQHTATHCNTMQHTATAHLLLPQRRRLILHTLLPSHTATHCNTLLRHTSFSRSVADLTLSAVVSASCAVALSSLCHDSFICVTCDIWRQKHTEWDAHR